jgi:hypothetical protein
MKFEVIVFLINIDNIQVMINFLDLSGHCLHFIHSVAKKSEALRLMKNSECNFNIVLAQSDSTTDRNRSSTMKIKFYYKYEFVAYFNCRTTGNVKALLTLA